MSTPKSMKNIADVVQWIETEKPFSPAFRKKVLGSVRKMKKLPQYDISLEQIPVDLDAFDKTWGSSPTRTIPRGFKTKQQFSNWRSQARSALTGFLDIPKHVSPPAPEDDWSQLISDLEDAGVHQKKLISVTVLANAARQTSLTPAEVSRLWLQTTFDSADTAGQYEAFKAARALIHQYRASITTPTSPDFAIPVRKSAMHCVRLDLPPRFADEVASWREKFIRGIRKGHRGKKRKSARSPKRADQVLRGVTYVYTAMVTVGLLDPGRDPSISDMLDPDALNEVIERELMGEFPWRKLKVTSLFEYLNNWKLFVRGCGHSAEALAEVIADFTEFENVKTMSTARRDWSETFMLDTYKQAAFFGLPRRLFGEAKKAMLAYETGSQYEKDIAIALGIAACAAAIWTSLPLRISTLLKLTHGGEKADVQIHGSRHGLVVTTPPDIVKNGYSHRYITLTPKPGGNPREIVAWFVSEVRPLLLKHHIAPHLRDPARLFGGVSYARLSSIWRSVTLEAGVPMTPHQVRHAIATVMANQPGADYSIIAALLGDTEATIRKNYAVVDQARKSAEGQHLLAQIHGNLLMRGAA